MENMSLCNGQFKAGRADGGAASRVSVCVAKTLPLRFFFSNAINMINVKLCMMVVLTELYLFIPHSMTLIVVQGHSSVKQF